MTAIKLGNLNAPTEHSKAWLSSFSAAAPDIQSRVATAQVYIDPFAHVVVPDLIPAPLYDLMIQHAIPDDYLRTLDALGRTSNNYPNRWVMPLHSNLPMLPQESRQIWQMTYDCITNVIAPALLNQFGAVLRDRFQKLPPLHMDVLYVRDRQNYKLGPHTDSPSKICTFLIYLAAPGIQGPGTSFYVPRQAGFTCAGGPHHKREDFDLIKTVPYQANLMCAFAKTDRSFHGVEKIIDNTTRNLLICDIQIRR